MTSRLVSAVNALTSFKDNQGKEKVISTIIANRQVSTEMYHTVNIPKQIANSLQINAQTVLHHQYNQNRYELQTVANAKNKLCAFG